DLLEEPIDLFSFMKKYKRFMGLLAGASLLFVFHTIVNSYMFQIMQPLGGSEANVGTSLSIAALSELPTMFFFSWLLKRFKVDAWGSTFLFNQSADHFICRESFYG
ncbi:MAG: hypothetical protein ACTH9D_06135, partial [Enterococcus viikkiensis]